MKKAILISILVLLAGTVLAQVPSKPFNVYAAGGVTIPNSPSSFNDNYNMGYHGFAGLGLSAAPLIQVVGKVGIHNLTKDFDTFVDTDAIGGTFTAFTFGVDARLAIGAPMVPVKPFGFVGFGIANIKTADIESSVQQVIENQKLESVTETKLYYNIGAGLEFKIGPGLTLFVQAAYIAISSGDISDNTIGLVPISVGLKL